MKALLAETEVEQQAAAGGEATVHTQEREGAGPGGTGGRDKKKGKKGKEKKEYRGSPVHEICGGPGEEDDEGSAGDWSVHGDAGRGAVMHD